MHEQAQKSGFQFSDELNISFLEDLYGGDFEQALNVFTFTKEQLRQDWPNVEQLYNHVQWLALKKLIHKLKPLFSYVGLDMVSEFYGNFENACADPVKNDMEKLFHTLKKHTERSFDIIDKEINRLTLFNA